MSDNELQLSGNVHVEGDREYVYDMLAEAMVEAALQAVDERGLFHLALSGGSTPEPFYMRLVIDPRFRAMPWKETHIWQVDERRVPDDDPQSNIRMIRETLAMHVPLKRKGLHPIPALDLDPAARYESALREELGHDGALDFVLLGMGDDAHTASLFPGSPAIKESKWVAVNEGPRVVPPPRVTLTYELINRSRKLAVLVTGEQKRDALLRVDKQLRESGPDPENLPITGLPGDERLSWYLDADAAGYDPLAGGVELA